jgi:hypothetical protein
MAEQQQQKLDPLIVGLPAYEVGAAGPPIKWKRDVMSYHSNTLRLVDPELPDIEQSYVVLLKSDNPVAREWQLSRMEQSCMYLLQTKSRSLTMHDDLLCNRLGKEGVNMVLGELLERLPELVSKDLVRPPRNMQPILCGEDEDDDPAEVASEMVRGDLHIVSRKCFYGKPDDRLRCIVPEKHCASEEEQLKQYRNSHEQKAVAVPLTMWNRRCEAE